MPHVNIKVDADTWRRFRILAMSEQLTIGEKLAKMVTTATTGKKISLDRPEKKGS